MRLALAKLRIDSVHFFAVNLFTWNADPHFGQVFDADGVTPLGDGFVAEIWGAANPTEELQPLAGPFAFRSGPSAGWLREGALNLPDSFGNETAWLQLRVWYRPWHASFEAATAKQERVGWSPLAEVPKSYRELCQLYLPRPIRDEAEDAEATAMMNALAVFPKLNAEQRDYLDVLTEMVDAHSQAKDTRWPKVKGVEVFVQIKATAVVR